jgi:hypothetical protein
MDPIEMLKQVKAAAGLDEAYHVSRFKGYRPTKQGGAFEVTVEVWDSGPHRKDSQYVVRAVDEHGRMATGIPRSTLAEALASVQWIELDRDDGAAASRETLPSGRHRGSPTDPT